MIRSKVYRAIPELDPFSNAQCERFVVAANSSWLRRFGRWMAVGVTGAGTVFAAVMGSAFFMSLIDPQGKSEWSIPASGAMFVMLTFPGLVVSLIVRDVLLRGRVRRLIRVCGSCSKCRYSLLGICVGADMRVTCPECGEQREVDASMGELATDEKGAAVYRPEAVRVDAIENAWRKARRRRMFKRSAIAVGAFVFLLAGGYGAWWGFLLMQARAATHGGSLKADLAALNVVSGRDVPGMSEGDRVAEWERYVAIVRGVKAIQKAVTELPEFGPSAGQYVSFDPNALRPEATVEAFEKRMGPGSLALSRRFTLEVLSRARDEGATARMRELLTLRAPLRPMRVESDRPLYETVDWGFEESYGAAYFNAARMLVALPAGDRAEYLGALEEIGAIGTIVERQGFVIDYLTASAMRQLVALRVMEDMKRYPDDSWAAGALEVLRRKMARGTLGAAFGGDRAFGEEMLRRFFADTGQVQSALLGRWPGEYKMFVSRTQLKPLEIGTYWGNRDALRSKFDELGRMGDTEAWQRIGAGVRVTGKPLIDLSSTHLSSLFTLEDGRTREFRRCLIAVAAEMFQRAHGRSASTVDELAPMLPEVNTLVDPFTGKQFLLTPRAVGSAVVSGGAEPGVRAPSDGPAVNGKPGK